ncbi:MULTISPECIES: oxidoreductase [Rhizobium]|uniref:Short-subunit dehydrogenase n=1 Tax=Rhizobium esperanzae TaxID=1967781 RepID=A0A7W6UTA8_9HYPH|nr:MULTISPECIES: oxidoreductase [Rhizobium]MBB4443938.1 short-subunit dehydrogenase [Rhizobium esperanzae]MDH6206543.1 short-subunit dehydrogenase [Rhizobium leguminosarum]
MSNNNRGVAVVTGAGAGIGRATARALVTAGYRVFGTSRKATAGSANGITMLTCDVTDSQSVASMIAEVIKQAGRIDVLVNNAGGALIGAAEESSIEQAQALFDLNVFGIIRVTNEVLPIMRNQRSGRIINISSVVGFIPSPFSALYTATKHAVEGYSESLDHEVRSLGIRVLLVEPAFTRTALDHNSTQPDRMVSVYDGGRKTTEAVWNTAIKAGDAPEVVGEAVVKAATTKSPKLRYPASKAARQLHFLRRFVPASAFDKSLRKQMKLPV